jgi:pseudouridylate synthase
MFNKKNKKVEQVRLNKFIASSGLCSRRKADELIEQGVVKVNGTVVKELGFSVSTKDKVSVNGQPLKKSNLVYIKYYKPAGYITTMSDEKGRKTIYDILPQEVKDLKPVGRLDKDSTGLLIMTNDGDFINKMTHPSIKIPKVYRVTAEGKMNQQHLLQMAKGIEIEQGKIAYADSAILDYEGKNTVLQIILYQGMNRQIRKMLDSLGFPVISLKRISHGTINIQGLKKGQFKYLKPREVTDLLRQIKKLEKQASKEEK